MKPTIEAFKMGPKNYEPFRSPLTGVDLIVLPVKAASERERAMSEGRACVAGSAIVARRESRSAMPERLNEGGRATTAQTSNGIQKRWRALQTRRTAMRRTVVQMAARIVVA